MTPTDWFSTMVPMDTREEALVRPYAQALGRAEPRRTLALEVLFSAQSGAEVLLVDLVEQGLLPARRTAVSGEMVQRVLVGLRRLDRG